MKNFHKVALWMHMIDFLHNRVMSDVIEMKSVPIWGQSPCDSLWQICRMVRGIHGGQVQH